MKKTTAILLSLLIISLIFNVYQNINFQQLKDNPPQPTFADIFRGDSGNMTICKDNNAIITIEYKWNTSGMLERSIYQEGGSYTWGQFLPTTIYHKDVY